MNVATQPAGYLIMSLSPAPTSDVEVYFQVTGTAQNVDDFSNIFDHVTIPAFGNFAYITINPVEDNRVEFVEAATITLVLTNGYVVNPTSANSTVFIHDNTNEIFSVVATNLGGPIGIDYHAPSNSLVVSANYDLITNLGADTNNFVLIDSNGVVSAWSGVHGLQDEIKLATVKTTAGGFTNGEIFFGTGVDGIIGKIPAFGTSSNVPWLSLSNSANPTHLRGGFYVDDSGSFGGDLLVVTGDGGSNGGEVWRINSSGLATNLARITNNVQPHHEGIISLTNDVAKWGPWAGKILVGAETWSPKPRIHAVAADGTVTPFDLGIAPEDFDLIQTNQDLYCVAYNGFDSKILKLSRNYLTNYVGDLLITESGEPSPFIPKLHIIHWSPSEAKFIQRSITMPPSFSGHFEHVSFAPISLPPLPQ